MNHSKLGKYDIRATLGRGASGVVYEGWDPAIARRVAIKTVRLPSDSDTEAADMFARCKREAQAAGRLSHPNIVGVFDYGETDELAYIVMEYVDGRTLKTALDGGEQLPPAEIQRVMIALLAGLHYSHANGVVHRDVKPANIMITSQGQVKIADFGIARIESSNMTQVGTVMGTPAYMSPEQFMGHTVDRRTDIYSAGVVLYQLLTGTRPFEGTISGIMHKALHTDPPRPSALAGIVPGELDAVVAKAMARRPGDRFDSADAFSHALHDAFDGARTVSANKADATIVSVRSATPITRSEAALAAGRKPFNGRFVVAASLLLLLMAGGTTWYLTGLQPVRQQAEQTVVAVPKPPASVPAPQPKPVTMPASPPAVPAPSATIEAPEPPPAEVPVRPSLIGLAEARVLARDVPCSLIDISESQSANVSSRLHVSGPTLPGDAFNDFIAQLRGPGRLVDVQTDRLEPDQCPVLEVVADTVRQSREGGSLRVILPEAPIAIGGRMTVKVQGVTEGAVAIDLYAADGSVQHILRRIVPSGSVGGDMVATAAAGGSPGPRLVVLISTKAPLDLRPGAASESSSSYLAALRTELARLTASGAEKRADIGMVSISAAARPPTTPLNPAPVPSARLRMPGLNAGKCADIVGRVQLGEALSDADRSVLQSSCGR